MSSIPPLISHGGGSKRGLRLTTGVTIPRRMCLPPVEALHGRVHRAGASAVRHDGPVGKVVAGFFSFTEITDPGSHRSYNEWHQLDHLPEQYPIAGVVSGQRWVLTPGCRTARLASGRQLD